MILSFSCRRYRRLIVRGETQKRPREYLPGDMPPLTACNKGPCRRSVIVASCGNGRGVRTIRSMRAPNP
jgi:hypothetical protein